MVLSSLLTIEEVTNQLSLSNLYQLLVGGGNVSAGRLHVLALALRAPATQRALELLAPQGRGKVHSVVACVAARYGLRSPVVLAKGVGLRSTCEGVVELELVSEVEAALILTVLLLFHSCHVVSELDGGERVVMELLL